MIFTSSLQAQFAGSSDQKFDYLRIGNPMQNIPLEKKQPKFDDIDIESWMLSSDDWNLKKQVACNKAGKGIKNDVMKNILQEMGLSNETLLVFTVALLAMLIS